MLGPTLQFLNMGLTQIPSPTDLLMAVAVVLLDI